MSLHLILCIMPQCPLCSSTEITRKPFNDTIELNSLFFQYVLIWLHHSLLIGLISWSGQTQWYSITRENDLGSLRAVQKWNTSVHHDNGLSESDCLYVVKQRWIRHWWNALCDLEQAGEPMPLKTKCYFTRVCDQLSSIVSALLLRISCAWCWGDKSWYFCRLKCGAVRGNFKSRGSSPKWGLL